MHRHRFAVGHLSQRGRHYPVWSPFRAEPGEFAMAKIDLSKISRKISAKPELPAAGNGVGAATAPTAESGLERLRGILCGSLLEKYAHEAARIETRVAMEASKIRAEVGELTRRFEGRIAQIDSSSQRGQAELREQILKQSSVLNDAIVERSDKALQKIDKGFQELRDSKIERSQFTNFLASLTSHLDQQVAPPNAARAGAGHQGSR